MNVKITYNDTNTVITRFEEIERPISRLGDHKDKLMILSTMVNMDSKTWNILLRLLFPPLF